MNLDLLPTLGEIRAERSRRRYQANPVAFMEEVLQLTGDKYYLDPWQRDLVHAVADVHRHKNNLPTVINHDGKSMITVRAMHGPGKTFIVAGLMHWFNACFKGRIICTAPKEKQLLTRLWPSFRKILFRAGPAYAKNIKVDSGKITWNGDEDWCAIAETASAPENLAGYHDDYMLFIVDEASGVDEAMFPVIEGAISTGTLVILILIGNPTKNQGTFFASHCTPKVAQHYHQIRVELDKTTRVSHEWVQRMVDKYGRNSPVVKVRCYGEFADTDTSQLIPFAWLVQAMERDHIDDGSIKRKRISVDVADGGDDFTVVTGATMGDRHTHIHEQREHNFPASESPILAAHAAIAMWEEMGCSASKGDDMVVDSMGVGAGTAGYLIERGYPVVTYKGGEASDDVKQWRNRRTQSYIVMRDAHREGNISYGEAIGGESWDEFAAQMCSVKTKPGVERVEELETKEAMKRRGLKSPDHADGVAMLFATQVPHVAGRLEVMILSESTAAGDNW